MNADGECTCRKTDAIALTAITGCTAIAMATPIQTALRHDERVACLQYDDTLEGMFRTPSLLNVGDTPPYFHSGAVQTLEDVIWHYNQGGGAEGTFAGTKSPQIKPAAAERRRGARPRGVPPQPERQDAGAAGRGSARERLRIRPPSGTGRRTRRSRRSRAWAAAAARWARAGWVDAAGRPARAGRSAAAPAARPAAAAAPPAAAAAGSGGGGRGARRDGRFDCGRRYVRALTPRARIVPFTLHAWHFPAGDRSRSPAFPTISLYPDLEATLCLGSSDSSVPP